MLEILTPIWHVKAETARAVRQRIRAVLEWAVAMELRADNPCDHVLPVPGPQNDILQHRRALPHKDVAAAIETVRASASVAPAIKLAFEFLVLTAARSGEVRLATWDEIDTAGQVWTVPAMRMKAKREHRVLLCRPAVEIFEAALAHVIQNKVEAAYARSDLFERRRRLMDDWATYLARTQPHEVDPATPLTSGYAARTPGCRRSTMRHTSRTLREQVGLIRFGGHLPKGEYDVDHDGHAGQADAAELHG